MPLRRHGVRSIPLMHGKRGGFFRLGLVALMATGCGTARPAPSAPPTKREATPLATGASPLAPEPPVAPLRTGTLAPLEESAVELQVLARQDLGKSELLELSVPTWAATERYGEGAWHSARVSLGGTPGPVAFVGTDAPASEPRPGDPRGGRVHLWVKRAKSSEPVTGTLFTPAITDYEQARPGHRIPFSATIGSGARVDPGLERTWAAALASWFQAEPGVFYQFAASRVRERFLGGGRRSSSDTGNPGGRNDELMRLMDTMTGRLSIQEALQRDRALYLSSARRQATIPIDKIRPPSLTPHPWEELRKGLRGKVQDEPLARATPAEFYFVRTRDFGKLLDVVDVLEDWGQPAANVLDGHAEDRGTVKRYEAELGLARTAVTRALGPALVTDLAIVGSDPYVHEGTDVTLLFRVKSAALFQAALASAVAVSADAHGGVVESAFTHEAVTVTTRRSADGAIRQHRASVDGLELVSNSPGAIRRVISAIHGKRPRLSDEPDFLYMLARDAGAPDDVLAYLGDRFVANVVGPRQKIGEARRQLALAELSTPGYAALLSGWLTGSSPATSAELLEQKLLTKADLRHADGAPIEWQPGRAARSKWGTPAALEPLIDLPEVSRVTPAEQAGYEGFARSYESLWSDKIDPVALRLNESRSAGRTELDADLRVLPLLRREYRDLTEMAGTSRLQVPGIASGVRFTVGIGKDASLRRELTEAGRSFGGRGKLAFDWVGDYAIVGVGNRNELPNAARNVLHGLELPDRKPPRSDAEDVADVLRDLPVYAAIGVRSRLGAAVALTAFREMARDAAPGIADWTTVAPHRGNEVVRVTVHESGASASLYYSLLPSALVCSLNEATLHAQIDSLLDAAPTAIRIDPPALPGAAGEPQVALELAGDRDGALHRVLGWLGSEALSGSGDRSRGLAEAVLRGDPETAKNPERARDVMRASLGVVVLTPDGQQYTLTPDGVRDPVRGTAHAPAWPELPVPGSPLDRVLARLARVRAALSFDDEPGSTVDAPLQSLHGRMRVELR